MDPTQQLPSLPMTGPAPAPRRLDSSEQDPAMDPSNDYIVPANPQVLMEHASQPHIVQSVLRRRLQPETFGPRRL